MKTGLFEGLYFSILLLELRAQLSMQEFSGQPQPRKLTKQQLQQRAVATSRASIFRTCCVALSEGKPVPHASASLPALLYFMLLIESVTLPIHVLQASLE